MYKRAFKDLYSITDISKLRNFQFRLLHNKVFCNDVLYHWGKVPSQCCEWCEFNKQNILHLLFHCVYAQKIWKFIIDFLESQNITVRLTLTDVILNNTNQPAISVVNFIVLVSKFYIYKCKVQNKLPNISGLGQIIDEYYAMESYNANITGKTHKHVCKWRPVIPELTQDN